MSLSGAAMMEGVAEFVRVKEELNWEQNADESIVLLPEHRIERLKDEPVFEDPLCPDTECKGPEHYGQDKAGLVPDHGQSLVEKVELETDRVKDEHCKEELSRYTRSCGPGLYAEQDKAELVPEQGQSIVTQNEATNRTVSAKQDPLQECEFPHKSIFDQHPSPQSHARETADRRTAVAGTPQDIDEIFKCETCGKTFNQIFYLTSHMQLHKYNLEMIESIETETKAYSCETCGKQFATKKLLYEHELDHIPHEFPCEICGKMFSFKYQLTNHARIHTGERPYKCTMCTKQFAFHSNLIRHERRHTEEKLYRCNVCDMRFRYYSKFTVHRRIHTIRIKIPCDECGKLFFDIESLTIHRRIHTGEKPYSC